jgi:hypothetical protein
LDPTRVLATVIGAFDLGDRVLIKNDAGCPCFDETHHRLREDGELLATRKRSSTVFSVATKVLRKPVFLVGLQ